MYLYVSRHAAMYFLSLFNSKFKIYVIFVLNISLYKPLILNIAKLKIISKETQVPGIYIVDFSRDA